MLNSDISVRKWKPTKDHQRERCGTNLYVRGFISGRKQFQMRINDVWIDLGNYPDRALAEAREITLTAKRLFKSRLASMEQIKRAAVIAESGVEFEQRINGAHVSIKEPSGIPTFDELYRSWYQLQLKSGRWTHPASIAKPMRVYERHAAQSLGNLRIDKITRSDLKNLLQPIYLELKDTGPDLRGYINEVLEEAVDQELIQFNPCPPNNRFTKSQVKTKHAASLHYARLPELWDWIEDAPFGFTVKVAMRTAIITAHRASVVAFARWEHIDLERGTWTIPEKPDGARHQGYMKSGREFTQVLPSGLVDQLRLLQNSNHVGTSEFVFRMPSGKPVHPETLRRNFKKFAPITTHGLRNTFKTWALHEQVDQFVVDRYVDHALQGLDRAYRRDDMLAERTKLGQRYFEYVTSGSLR